MIGRALLLCSLTTLALFGPPIPGTLFAEADVDSIQSIYEAITSNILATTNFDVVVREDYVQTPIEPDGVSALMPIVGVSTVTRIVLDRERRLCAIVKRQFHTAIGDGKVAKAISHVHPSNPLIDVGYYKDGKAAMTSPYFVKDKVKA